MYWVGVLGRCTGSGSEVYWEELGVGVLGRCTWSG